MAFHRLMGRAHRMGMVSCVSVGAASAALAATPLDFPSPNDIQSGRTYAWRWGSSYLMEQPSVGPFQFTYAIGPGFMANQANIAPGAARAVVEHSLDSWTAASRGQFQFAKAPWSAVMNIGGSPPDQWEGPSIQEWLSGDYGNDVYPGWGANFEFFSVPTGFTIQSQGVQYIMKPTNLAFTVVNRIGSTHIASVDIYFNSSFNWFDAHNTDAGGSGGGQSSGPMYDLTTVLLHELGHALGLDHPNEAQSNGSANLSPYTFDFGQPWSTQELMYGVYQGGRNHPTIDEVGGVAFLYGLPSPLDINGDGEVGGADLATLLANWGGTGLGIPGDLNYNGVVDSVDLGLLLSNFGLVLNGPGPSSVIDLPNNGQPNALTPLDLPIIRDCYHVPLNEAGTPE